MNTYILVVGHGLATLQNDDGDGYFYADGKGETNDEAIQDLFNHLSFEDD